MSNLSVGAHHIIGPVNLERDTHFPIEVFITSALCNNANLEFSYKPQWSALRIEFTLDNNTYLILLFLQWLHKMEILLRMPLEVQSGMHSQSLLSNHLKIADL